jgi:glucokinase
MAQEMIAQGEPPSFCPTEEGLPQITAQSVAEAANLGDPLAARIFRIVGDKLGLGLSILVDILNPERIIVGSIYGRQQALLEPIVTKRLEEEALTHSMVVCQIVPAGLGEMVGDYSALSVAAYALEL